jgi:hypothetical protein
VTTSKESLADWKHVTSELATLLKGAGFERSGATFFRRQADGVVVQVTVEKFRWNVGLIRKFQLKLTIYLPDQSGHPFSLKDWHPHYTPLFGKSAGYLWGDEGSWFELPASLPDERFSAELRRRVCDDVLPFLARCDGIDATVAVLEEENARRGKPLFSAGLALALAKLGRKEQSRKHFEQSPGDRSAIRQLAAHYEIVLDE